jgi:hypothetical protein
MRHTTDAATTGTPGGTKGTSAAATSAPADGRDHPGAAVDLAGQEREEERREGGVEPERLGVAEQRSGYDPAVVPATHAQ